MLTIPISFPGFEIQQVTRGEITLTITAGATNPTAVCPACQQVSRRVHSYYTRSPHDLPVSGQAVQLVLHVRRFRCQNRQCPQQTFVERLPEVVPRYARRTTRLLTTLSLFAVVLSGRAGERLLKQIGMAESSDTLLRLAKRAGSASIKAPQILGVDDFAFRRGRTYGTILVNLETHRPVDLLAERTAEALIDWRVSPSRSRGDQSRPFHRVCAWSQRGRSPGATSRRSVAYLEEFAKSHGTSSGAHPR